MLGPGLPGRVRLGEHGELSGFRGAFRPCRGCSEARTSWAKALSCASLRRGGSAAEDRSAADRRRPNLGDRYRSQTDHERAASARSWLRKTCSWSGFAWCPNEPARSKSPRSRCRSRAGRVEVSRRACRSRRCRSSAARPSFWGASAGLSFMPRHQPQVMRVGQELDFRIKVTGPAAWGMTDRPDLARYARLGLGLRIEPRPDETTDEPPARSFVYRLRPTHAGEAVLPPVAIAAFDPSLSRYVTHVTAGVPIRVVAVAILRSRNDQRSIHLEPPSVSRCSSSRLESSLAGDFHSFVYLILRQVRRRLAASASVRPRLRAPFCQADCPIPGALSVETLGESMNSHARLEPLNFDGPEFNGEAVPAVAVVSHLRGRWYCGQALRKS